MPTRIAGAVHPNRGGGLIKAFESSVGTCMRFSWSSNLNTKNTVLDVKNKDYIEPKFA